MWFLLQAGTSSRQTGNGAAPGRTTSNGAAAAPKQKAGKVVFAGGNRLAAKQAAAKEQKVSAVYQPCMPPGQESLPVLSPPLMHSCVYVNSQSGPATMLILQAPAPPKEEEKKEDPKGFAAFSGKGRSLKG